MSGTVRLMRMGMLGATAVTGAVTGGIAAKIAWKAAKEADQELEVVAPDYGSFTWEAVQQVFGSR